MLGSKIRSITDDFWNNYPTFGTEGTFNTKLLVREGSQWDRLLNNIDLRFDRKTAIIEGR